MWNDYLLTFSVFPRINLIQNPQSKYIYTSLNKSLMRPCISWEIIKMLIDIRKAKEMKMRIKGLFGNKLSQNVQYEGELLLYEWVHLFIYRIRVTTRAREFITSKTLNIMLCFHSQAWFPPELSSPSEVFLFLFSRDRWEKRNVLCLHFYLLLHLVLIYGFKAIAVNT